MAKEIYFDETSGQLAVNNALRALQDAKNKAVKLEYYSLYVEVTYPLNESDYSSGYQAYKNAVTTGKTLLNSEGLTAEKAKEAYNAIQTAKQSLVKPNAKVPTISATDTYYQSNNYNNMIDGNINTKCWFNSNQEIGKEVKFTFTRPINISSIQIIQPSNAGEDIIDGADVQISTDGKNWTTVGTLDNSAFEKTITFDKTLTKYVRIVLTEGKGNWYQIAEVKFELEEIPEDSTLKDMILEAETLNITGKSSGSVNEMIDALIVAQKSYVEGKVDVTEETNNLRNAINALRDTVTSNKEKLTNKINDAKEIENNNYDLLLFCNPNNPTGQFIKLEDIKEIVKTCENKNTRIFIDEAFIEFIENWKEKTVSLLKNRNVFIMRAFTKFFAIPGLRLGYGLGFDENILKKMWEEKEPWTVNTFANLAGLTMLDDKEYIKKSEKWILEEKKFMYKELSDFQYIKAYKTECNFILLKIYNISSASLRDKMIEKNILIRDASNFKFLDFHFVRLAIKDRESNLKLLETLDTIMEYK